MAQPFSLSLLFLVAAAAAARGAGEATPIVIDDFAGPVDAFFLDDGSAAGLPSSGNSALEKVEARSSWRSAASRRTKLY